MTDQEVHEIIKNQVCKEIEEIADKIKKNGTMSDVDLEKLDKLYHTKKDLLASHGMDYPEEYYPEGMSGARGRAANGQYMSRAQRSYADGYNRGYSEAMGQSGHYPWYTDGPHW